MAGLPMDQRDGWIWFDGELKPWKDAKVHVLTHGLHYGSCVFEGQRAYGGEVFKLREHTERLISSGQMLDVTIPYTADQIDEACRQVLAANELTDAYIQAHPSQYFSLREFGQHFPEFIQQPNRPWLSALGSFEWTLCSAFDAADAPRLTEQDIATVAPESWPHLRFATHPSLRVLGFNWNVPEMWKVLTSDAPEAIQATSTEPAYWIVWRDDLITRYRSMPDDEQHALACVRDGGNFEEICIALADFHAEEQIPLRIATLLKTWIGQGLLSGLNT